MLDRSRRGCACWPEALTVLEASGRGDLLAEAYRLQGILLLRQGRWTYARQNDCQ